MSESSRRFHWRGETSGQIADSVDGDPRSFHRTVPGYRETRLQALPDLAEEWSVASVHVKDESDRFGLPAFKALGASWAVNRAVSAHLGVAAAESFPQLAERTRDLGLGLVTASDGNHGRALARVAGWLGMRARIYVPAGLPASTLEKIADEGAEVVDTGVDYDEAVNLAASNTASDELLIQDTAWAGYEEVPGWIVDGYSTLFAEVDEQLGEATGASWPDLILVPTGVGSLLQAAVEHYRAHGPEPKVMAVEPVTAACVTESMLADRPVSVDTSRPTSMAGLNCGTVSSLAWPVLRTGLDGAITVSESETAGALEFLHERGVDAGPCGAASLAGVRAARDTAGGISGLGLDSGSRIVLLSTESAAANEGIA